MPTANLGQQIAITNRGQQLIGDTFQIELEFRSVGFWEEGKTAVPGEKPLGARTRTNNKLNPHMTPSLGILRRWPARNKGMIVSGDLVGEIKALECLFFVFVLMNKFVQRRAFDGIKSLTYIDSRVSINMRFEKQFFFTFSWINLYFSKLASTGSQYINDGQTEMYPI